jgi:serine/threonine protein kinase
MGTVGYMSPEQVRGQPADHRSDIFSFGSILYEMLSGQRAFQRETMAETMTAILKEEPTDLTLSNRQISAQSERVVRTASRSDLKIGFNRRVTWLLHLAR